MKNIKLNINLTTLIIIGVVIFIVMFGGFKYYFNKIGELNDQITEEIKLRNALTDSMTTYRNEANELVSEKLTLQADLSKLKDLNDKLTDSQKNLLTRIEDLDEDKSVITAALIEANILIDSLLHSGLTIIDPKDSTITFSDELEHIRYDIKVTNVVQADTLTESNLFIRELILPNKTFVDFHWELDEREDYPISFSVTNTNPYYQVHNIESYAIPQLKKRDIDPTTWNKITGWFDRNGGVVIKVSVAGAAGYFIGRSVSK
ncbi:MAG: hypothetical protein ACOC22_00160 [bacterium]